MDYAHTPAIATLTTLDVTAKVIAVADKYHLWWTDGIATEWHETYPDLSTALARLAVLHHCVATTEGFADPDPRDFDRAAARFLETSAA